MFGGASIHCNIMLGLIWPKNKNKNLLLPCFWQESNEIKHGVLLLPYLGWCFPSSPSKPQGFKNAYAALLIIYSQPCNPYPMDETLLISYYSIAISMADAWMSSASKLVKWTYWKPWITTAFYLFNSIIFVQIKKQKLQNSWLTKWTEESNITFLLLKKKTQKTSDFYEL